MDINLIADSSVSSAPAGFIATIQAAADIYDQDFPGNYTVNLTYGWGTFDNETDSELTDPNSGVFSLGGVDNATTMSYTLAKILLSADAADASLPVDPGYPSYPFASNGVPAGANAVLVSSSQEKALGIYDGSPNTVDGSIGFNIGDGSTSADFTEKAALVEIGHALGWLTGAESDYAPTLFDLFRYGSPGVYQWAGGQPAYFSLDGGDTDLANFSTTFDYTLFTNLGVDEPFTLPPILNDSAPTLTSLDIEIFNLLGFGVPSPTGVVVSAATFAAYRSSLDALVDGFAISDSAANVLANLGALAADSKVTSIAITSGSVDVSVSTFFGGRSALDKIVGGFAISDAAFLVVQGLAGIDSDSRVTSVDITSGTAIIAAGTTVRVAELLETGAGTSLTVAENLHFAGSFSEGARPTLSVSSGDALTLTGAAHLAGTLSGAGELVLAGSGAIKKGAMLSVADWSISGASAIVTLGEALTYAGAFVEGSGATLEQSGGGLTLTGSADFTGATVEGAYVLSSEGATAVSDLTIDGKLQWDDAEAVTQSGGNVRIVGAATLSIAAAGTWTIADDSDIKRGGSTTSKIENAGLLAKTGAGTSIIAVPILDTGVISVSGGLLDLKVALSGTGDVEVGGGATLEVDAAVVAGQSFDYASGSTGEFALDDLDIGGSQRFHAVISGFGAGDAIDAGAPFGAKTTFVYTPDAGGTAGVLALTDGSKRASIDFVGDYTSANFAASADGHGGTLITFHA